jgi:hypothetical protein
MVEFILYGEPSFMGDLTLVVWSWIWAFWAPLLGVFFFWLCILAFCHCVGCMCRLLQWAFRTLVWSVVVTGTWAFAIVKEACWSLSFGRVYSSFW